MVLGDGTKPMGHRSWYRTRQGGWRLYQRLEEVKPIGIPGISAPPIPKPGER